MNQLRDDEKLKKEIDIMYGEMLNLMIENTLTPEEAFYEMILAVLETSKKTVGESFDIGYKQGYQHGAEDTLVNSADLLSKMAIDYSEMSEFNQYDCECEGECRYDPCKEDME